MKKLALLVLFVASLTLNVGTHASEPKLYTEGPVTMVSYIKVKPGMFDAYMKWLSTERKQLMEEYKKAGLIVGYNIYNTIAHNPSEPDLILTVTYKNMAAFDGLSDRQDVIEQKLMGSMQKANEATITRGQMRDVLGSRMMRELISN